MLIDEEGELHGSKKCNYMDQTNTSSECESDKYLIVLLSLTKDQFA